MFELSCLTWLIIFVIVWGIVHISFLIRSYRENGFMGKVYNETQLPMDEENYPPMKQFNRE